MRSASVTGGAAATRVRVATPHGEAYGGVRALFGSLRGGPEAVAASGFAPEARALFGARSPGVAEGTPQLREIALSPSERRLHRESEQVFRALSAAALGLRDRLARAGVDELVLGGLGNCDSVTLRALRRLCEVADFREQRLRLTLQGSPPDVFPGRNERLLHALAGRVTLVDERPGEPPPAAVEPADPEAELLAGAVHPDASAVDRLACCLGALQHCFFSTNLEASWRVAGMAEHLLGDLGRVPGDLTERLSARLSSEHNLAVEFEASALATVPDVRAFLHKHRGVVTSFAGEFEASFRHFEDMLGREPVMPELAAQSYLYRALTLVKRLGRVAEARGLVHDGLGLLDRHDTTPALRREEGWLRNVLALTHFFDGDLRAAFAEERLALECVAGMADASATHLKINVISNLSVLQETAKKNEEALKTWTRFLDRDGGRWDASFLKHHRYRAAGLRVKIGDRRAAVPELRDACDAAARLGDVYHEAVIAQELGGLLLDLGETGEAAASFERARAACDRFAEPYAWSLAAVGSALASGEAVPAEVAAVALRSLTYPDEAAALAREARAGDRAALGRRLPRPRTKLNRPFDLVNV